MSLKPKFICITHDFPPMTGGVARFLASLAKFSKRDMEVWVPNEHQSGVDSRESGVNRVQILGEIRNTKYEIRSKRFWWGWWPRWVPLVRRCLEAEDEQVILVSHVFPIGTAAWIAKMLGGSEYTVLFHGTDLKRVRSKWKRWLLKRICKNARALFVNSLATQKILERLLPDLKSTVLTPGVEVGPEISKDEARVRLGIDIDEQIVLSVSRLVERKGIDTLILAFARLQTRDSRLETDAIRRLVIIGSGPYAEVLHQLAELNGMDVTWIEGASDDEVRIWYAAADVFCLPGREVADDVEGFGIVFLEAATAGLPVIAGKSGGAEEAVEDGLTGMLVEPSTEPVARALLELLNDSERAKFLGQTGRRRAIDQFSWEDRWRLFQSTVHGRQSTAVNSITCDTRLPTVDGRVDVSVVIPCWNHATELGETLVSLVKQTCEVREVIIVDDASSDDLEAVLKPFKELLPIQRICHSQNQGAAAARNTGRSVATGGFLLFLDADTVLEPAAISRMHQVLTERSDADFVYGDFYWGRIHFRCQPFSKAALERLNYIHTSSLIRREKAPMFDPTLKKFQDWDLWLTMAEQGRYGVWIPETLFTIKERKIGMSRWLPSFVHRMPWPMLGWIPKEVRRYREGRDIIYRKHKIDRFSGQ